MNSCAADISRQVWQAKYRYGGGPKREHAIADTWRRVARALAAVEPSDAEAWEHRFYAILENFHFLPGGRIQAGAGTGRNVTLFNTSGLSEWCSAAWIPPPHGERTIMGQTMWPRVRVRNRDA